MNHLPPLVEYIQTGGMVALLIVAFYGGIKKWWVFGWYYNELKQRHEKLSVERDGWKDIAVRSTNLAETVNELAKPKIP